MLFRSDEEQGESGLLYEVFDAGCINELLELFQLLKVWAIWRATASMIRL